MAPYFIFQLLLILAPKALQSYIYFIPFFNFVITIFAFLVIFAKVYALEILNQQNAKVFLLKIIDICQNPKEFSP